MKQQSLLPAGEGTITFNTVREVTGLSRSNILRKIKEGLFPKPFKYGGILLFSVSDIRRFISDPSGFNND
jgi:predicted DNA-binding transcriptional regulator AlpA